MSCLLRYETKAKDARKIRASFLLSFSVRLQKATAFFIVLHDDFGFTAARLFLLDYNLAVDALFELANV